MLERSLVLIKPDGVERGLIGEILKRFEQRGMRVVGLKLVQVDREFAKKHYAPHVSKSFYQPLEDYIVSAPVVAIVIEGINAVANIRKIVGGTEPSSALPGTIRGDYAHVTYHYADGKGIAIKNLIHASGTSEEAKLEVALWFTEKELVSYDLVHEKHTR